MGNCYGTAVNDHSRNSSSSKLSSPDASTQRSKPQGDHEKRSTAVDKVDDKISGNNRLSSFPAMKIFTLEELRTATRNFRMDSVLGEGGFGRVFKGWVDEKTYAPSRVGVGIPVAVKKAYPDHSYRHQEWQSEVKFLGRFSHPNLVRLLGFCWDDKEFLLVYQYMHRGSLENHLFRKGAEPLSWSRRFDIAVGAARGLAYLHNNSSTAQNQVIFRDFKPSNILLDSDFNAKISDFGLAKMGPADGDTHVSTRPKGTYGYAAPEYVATGHLYVKSDVYGFGVVLLELMSGRRAIDPNRPHGESNLVEWATPLLCKRRKLKRIMDPRLEEEFPMEGAWEAAQLILRCLEGNPRTRPSMDRVLEDLLRITAIKLKSPNSVPGNPPRQRLHFYGPPGGQR